MAKSKTEKITDIEQQIVQLQNSKKRLLQQHREQERKARTHWIIERGAFLESLIDGAENFTMEQIKELLKRTIGSTYGVKIVAEMKARNGEIPAQKSEIEPIGDS